MSGLSFRDPENQAFDCDGSWFRVAEPASAEALRKLRSSSTYSSLTGLGLLPEFSEVEPSLVADLLACAHDRLTRAPGPESTLFRVATLPVITYPWEWPNGMLAEAALATIRVRRELLAIGLDLKDASAFNIQFRGSRPVLMDVGSIKVWRPSPGWSAGRQFMDHFINPLAVGSSEYVSSADAWCLGSSTGVTSQQARSLMPAGLRRHLGLLLLQSSTRAIEGHVPVETRYGDQATANPDLARRATLSYTSRLEKHVRKLSKAKHKTTWAQYGSREHYQPDNLQQKTKWAVDFVDQFANGDGPVLDVGGNDGLIGSRIAERLQLPVVVLDPDTGALEALWESVQRSSENDERITPLVGDLTQTSVGAGLLGLEFSAVKDRLRPSAVLCQAVLHHLTITQGIPLALSVRALAQFNAPLQVEIATQDDDKVKLLLSQIPNWSGDYSEDAVVAALRNEFEHVQKIGHATPTRVVLNCSRPRGIE